jgi:hypothetical protein
MISIPPAIKKVISYLVFIFVVGSLNVLMHLYLGRSLFITILFILEVPVLIGVSITYWAYRSSGTREMVNLRYIKRIKERQGRAGLAFILCKKTGRILMNKQIEEPWLDMWLILGGNIRPKNNRENENGDTRSAAERRVAKLTSGDLEVITRRLIAQTSDDFDYLAEAMAWGYPPVHADVFEVEKVDREEILESDIKESGSLRWWTIPEITKSNKIQPHIKDLVLYICSAGYRSDHPGGPEYWKLSEPFDYNADV